MTQAEGYRARTLMVRKAARQHLLEVRRQRLAKHGVAVDAGAANQTRDLPETPGETEIVLHDYDAAADMDLVVVDTLGDACAAEQSPGPSEPDPAINVEQPAEVLMSEVGVDDNPAPPAPVADSAETTTFLADADAMAVLSASDPEAMTPAESTPTVAVKTSARKTRRPKKQKEFLGTEEDNLSILAAAMQDIDDDQCVSVTPSARKADIPKTSVLRVSKPAAKAVAAVNISLEAAPTEEIATIGPAEAAECAQDATVAPLDTPSDAPEPAFPQKAKTPPALDPVGGLENLPGAGPGLIWMLGQVGISSLEDLAQADADALSRNLGLVGQILNVGSWVAFARTACEPARG